ncbi:hypothetical protein J5751_07125 [bacterium]|nr:hypothetical protein [bacterium]
MYEQFNSSSFHFKDSNCWISWVLSIHKYFTTSSRVHAWNNNVLSCGNKSHSFAKLSGVTNFAIDHFNHSAVFANRANHFDQYCFKYASYLSASALLNAFLTWIAFTHFAC